MMIVVLVEGHRDTREMYSEFLSCKGVRVRACEDASGAFEQALSADVVIIDIDARAPQDGLRLANELRHACDVPIIAVSACAYPADAGRARHAGATMFIAKPCLPVALLGAVRQVAAAARARRQAKASIRPPAARPSEHRRRG
jgi:DNA-binding response OmpR family regulator